MKRRDVSRVLDLEHSAYPFPWNRGIFIDCIRVGYHCSVLEDGPDLVGYSILSAGAGEAHLLNLCVDPDRQGQGLGRVLLDVVINQAELAGCRKLFLEVRPSNPAAMALYRNAGFARIGRRPGYYPASDGREDALVLALPLNSINPQSIGLP